MLRFYLQILSVLASVLGIVLPLGWMLLTYLYYHHSVSTGQKVVLDTGQLSVAVCLLLGSLAGLFLTVKWIKRTKDRQRAMMRKFEEFSNS